MWDARRGMARKKFNSSISSSSQYKWKSPNKSWTSSVYQATTPKYSYINTRKTSTSLFAKNVSKNPYKVIKKDVQFIPKALAHLPSYYGKRYFPSTYKKQRSKSYSSRLQPSVSYPTHTFHRVPGYYPGVVRSKKFHQKLPQNAKNTKTKWVRKTVITNRSSSSSSVVQKDQGGSSCLNRIILGKPVTQNNVQSTAVAAVAAGKPSKYFQMQAKKTLKRCRRQWMMMKKMKVTKTYCIYFNRFGKCNRGDACKYVHDPTRVALCTRFLAGKCRMENCPFSHVITKTKVPLCNFFLRGNCHSEKCPYLHVFVGKDAPVCNEFATTGFCAKADSCRELHMRVCPQFYHDGNCPKGEACELPHKRKTKTKKQIIAEKKRAKRQEVETANREQCQIIPKLSITVAKEEEENDELLLPTIPKLLLTAGRSIQNKSLMSASLVVQENPTTTCSSDSSVDPLNLPDSGIQVQVNFFRKSLPSRVYKTP